MIKYRNILIIGATSGIGKALAEEYSKIAETVIITGRREHLLKEICARHKNMIYEITDVTCQDTTIHTLNALLKKVGDIELIIHSAGTGSMNPDLEFSKEIPAIQTNVWGWTAIVDWAYNRLIEQGYGHLAIISSIAGIRGLAPAPAYSASKAYQIHYIEALHQRLLMLKNKKVSITDIRPGFVDTPLLDRPDKFFWVLPVEKVAHAIMRSIASRKPYAYVTRRWYPLGFLIRWAPNKIIAWVLGKS